jgi:serine/threonine protein kinase
VKNTKFDWFEELQQECFIFTNTTLFIVILLQEIFYSLKVDNPKFLYFFSFFVFFLFDWWIDFSLCFCVILILLNILRKRLKLTFDTFNFVELIFVCLGFWIGTNSWESRRRKSKYSFIWNEWLEIEWKITTINFVCLIVFQTQSGVGPVCCMAPESIANRNYSKKSDVWTFGIVGLWILSIFILFHFTIWCDIFVLMSSFTSIIEKLVCFVCLVYEIVAQCEPHKDKDVFDVGVRIR